MTISDNDYKLLWGRAAGICSNPTCREELTVILEGNGSYNVGEMAHVIAKSSGGPRGVSGGGTDTYDNLILLCPTCHRKVDKSPDGQYPVNLLHEWKSDHEVAIRQAGKQLVFQSSLELKQLVFRLLKENKLLWHEFGPQSRVATADSGSNLYLIWSLRKLDTIVPNNRKIINSVEANLSLLSPDEHEVFLQFKMHANAFETNQYRRIDGYPQFPQRFAVLFSV